MQIIFVLLFFPLLVLVLALLVRIFLFQPFNSPSMSMAPALVVGDRYFVAKYAYGYSRYSFPLNIKLFSGRAFASTPDYGDIVVFRLPKDVRTDYIKRLVGLPGDRIQMKGGRLHINGEAVRRTPMPDLVGVDACGGGSKPVKRWYEWLPNHVSYSTLDCVDNGFYDDTIEYVVPAGHYFMMGDNRDNSTDSRVLSQVGYIPFENLVGRFALKYVSAEDMRRGRNSRQPPSR